MSYHPRPSPGAPPGVEPLTSSEVRTLWAACWAAVSAANGVVGLGDVAALTGRSREPVAEQMAALAERGHVTLAPSVVLASGHRRRPANTIRPDLVMVARPPT